MIGCGVLLDTRAGSGGCVRQERYLPGRLGSLKTKLFFEIITFPGTNKTNTANDLRLYLTNYQVEAWFSYWNNTWS